ncbi:MAG TPA: thiamine phosphate synthase [Myxococcota bacterium]|nr:thiamine phosphate synthase [Myxococcota bacterium]HQK51269.1 thiamine phosphate synthase [Myxococcota bacterium]
MDPRTVDWSLYLVTDRGLARGRPLAEVVAAAIRGGVTVVQYREKDRCTGEMVQEALEVGEVCRRLGALFLVNDRLDVALAAGADGLHVGQQDLSPVTARALLGPEAVLGVSAGSVEEAREAERSGADYIGASPVFATPTKADAGPPLGLEGLSAIAAAVSIPVLAIGGVHASNARSVIEAGASGVAVVSAILAAEDVEGAARALRQVVDSVRRRP